MKHNGTANLRQWFEQGMTWAEFLDASEVNVERMQQFYENSTVGDDAIRFFRERVPMHILAIGEDWCPDVVQNLALVARVVDDVSDVGLRILRRDENPELMDRYRTNGKKRIPVFVFLNRSFEELGSWRGRCKSADHWIFDEFLRGRAWQDVPKEELRGFNDEYDRRYLDTYLDETLREFQELLSR